MEGLVIELLIHTLYYILYKNYFIIISNIIYNEQNYTSGINLSKIEGFYLDTIKNITLIILESQEI